MAGVTYAGSTMAVSAALPAANDLASFQALTFESGDCSLQQFPSIARTWQAVEEPLVCKTTNSDVKGSSKWDPSQFVLSKLPGDAMQAILYALEADFNAKGAFRFTISGPVGSAGGGIIYVQAQVAKLNIADGGSQNDIHSATGTLFIQEDPVLDGA